MTRGRRLYDRIAPLYDALDALGETIRQRHVRPQLLAGLGGRILDAGVGTGRNFPFYPEGGDAVGVDFSTAMLRRAQRRQHRLGTRVHLLAANICQLPFADDGFDAAIATFLFCVLDDADQLPALRELARVCRPGGQIRILDYVRPDSAHRRWSTRLSAPIIQFLYNASLERNTEQYVAVAGLRVVERRLIAGDDCRMLVMRHA